MTTRALAYQVVLHRLLVSHLFDQAGDLLHSCLHLGHDAFLAIEGRLFVSPLCRCNYLNLLVEPHSQVLLALRPEGDLVLELSSEVFVHLAEHGGCRI